MNSETMKIAHMLGHSRVEVREAARPVPGPGEVLIRTAASALCGSEMHTYRHDGYVTEDGAAGNGGHEAAGIIEAVGVGVDAARLGQRVGVSAVAGCGHCDYCTRGQYTWCANYRVYSRMHAEYFLTPALACHPLPDDVPWDVGVLLTGDGMGVPYHTSTKLRPDTETVAVFGLGPVGLGNVLMQSHLGRRVIGIDRAPERLQLARQLGAAETVAAAEGVEVPAAIRDLTGGRGADCCIEAAGAPATVRLCFEAVRTNGLVIFNGEQAEVTLSPSADFIRRDITATGSWFYHFSEYPAMLQLYRDGLDVAALATHHLPLSAIDAAYQLMANGQSGKVIIEYDTL